MKGEARHLLLNSPPSEESALLIPNSQHQNPLQIQRVFSFVLMPHFAYILYSPTKDRYYIGHTQNPFKRLDEHISGYEKPTAPFVPWTLIGFLEKHSKSEEISYLNYQGNVLKAIEIKSGKTINQEFFKSLNRFSVLATNSENFLVYGGVEYQKWSNATVLGDFNLEKIQ